VVLSFELQTWVCGCREVGGEVGVGGGASGMGGGGGGGGGTNKLVDVSR